MAIKYLAGNRIQGTNAERPKDTGSVEITEHTSITASGDHNNFTYSTDWYVGYTNNSLTDQRRGSITFAAADLANKIPVGSTLISVQYKGWSKRYYNATSNPKIVGLTNSPTHYKDNSTADQMITDIQASSTIYVADSNFDASTYTGNGGDPVEFTDTFNSTGFTYVSDAIDNGDDVFFYFQGTPSTSNAGHYGVNKGAVLILNYSIPAGTLDGSLLESGTIYEETDTGKHFIRAKYGWGEISSTPFAPPNHRGIFTGGDDSNNPIDYITIATLGDASDFGDGGSTGKMGAAVGNGTLGIYGGDNNVLNQVTIATTANSTDFGDLTGIGGNATACADATRGVWTRGNINYITMASASNATDWGHDRSPNAGDPCAFADTTRGIISGGEAYISGWVDINDIDYITIQTISSATDFGDLTDGKRQLSGVANDTYGFAIAGYDGSSYLSDIVYVTIQTLGNASDFGNLTQSRTAQNSACGDATRAVLGGGYATSSSTNTIDYFTMGTSGSSSDFGDLTSARTRVTSCSDYVK